MSELKKADKINGLIIAVALHLPNIVAPILQAFSSISTLLLIGLYAICISIGLMVNKFEITGTNKKSWAFAAFVLALFAVDFLMRNNSELFGYFVSMFRCFIIPLCLFSVTKPSRMLLKYWCYFGVAIGVFYCLDPLLGYRYSGGYMPFGFNIMLPAFCGAIILAVYLRNKLFWLPAIIYLFEMAIFANKGSLITGVIVFAFIYAFKSRNWKKIFVRLLVLCLFGSFAWGIRSVFLQLLIDVAEGLSFDSYAINTFKMMLEGNSQSIFDARTNIWKDALALIKNKPFFGYGIGYFRETFNVYPHNLLLELMVSDGFFVTLVFVAYSIYCLRRIVKSKNQEGFIFGICLFILWAIPLFISLTLWDCSYFWLFFIFSDCISDKNLAATHNPRTHSRVGNVLTYGNN